MRYCIPAVLAPLLLVPLALTAMPSLAADEVRLKNGRVIEGDVESQPGADEVLVSTHSHGLTATLHFKASEVVEIRFGQSPAQRRLADFAARRTALAARDVEVEQPAEAWWKLALEARELQETPAFRELAQITIDHDPEHVAARKALGFVRQDNKWMKPADAALARGEVFFRGKWMPLAQRDMILADEERVAKKAQDDAEGERQRRLRAAELAKAEADVAKAEADAAKAKADVAKAEAQAKQAKADAERPVRTVEVPSSIYSYGSYAPVPSIIYSQYWNRGPGWGGRPGCTQPGGGLFPGPYRSPGLQINAQGQGNGYQWGLSYR